MSVFHLDFFFQTGGDASRSVLSPLFRTASALEFPNRAALMRWPAVIGSEIFISIPSTFSRSSEKCEKKAESVAGVLQRRIQCSTQCRGKHSLKKICASFIWGVNRRDQRFSTGGSQPKVGHRAILIGSRLCGRFNFSECCGINEYCDFMIRKICGC